MPDRPHPFFWVVLALAAVGGWAAWAAQPIAPSFALRSTWVYRAEVALAVFAAGYFLIGALWLSYRGRMVRRVELPGGAAVEVPESGALESAADAFEVFETKTVERLDGIDRAIAELDLRVAALEPGGGGDEARTPAA